MKNVMTRRMGLWTLCLFAVAAVAIAQSAVDGKWAGEVQGGRGPQQITLTLKADEGKLKGSATGGRGGEVAVDDGTIAGNTLKFKTKQQGRGGEITFTWTGTLKGDEIAMSRMAEGGQAQEFT